MTRKQFFAELAKYPGVTFDEQTELNSGSLQIDAPKGKIFGAVGCHTMVEPFENICRQSWKSEAYADLAERLHYGLLDCETEDCDICCEEGQ